MRLSAFLPCKGNAFCDIDKYFYEKMCSMQKNMQKLHARFVIKNVPELPAIPDTLVVINNRLSITGS